MGILPQIIVNSLIAGATYTLLTLGFNLVYSTSKILNLAHGTIAAVGGYTVFAFCQLAGLPLWLGLIAGVVTGALYAGLCAYWVYRPLRRRRASSLVLFVASLGLYVATQAALSLLFSAEFQSLPEVPVLAAVHHLAGAELTGTQIIMILFAILAPPCVWLILHFTMFGRAVRAISDDEEVARIMGINVERVVGTVFVIGGALAGFAGIFIGFDTGLYPGMGLPIVFEAAISAIIGGIGSFWGGIMGAWFLGFIENFSILSIDSEWKPAVTFIVLVLVLVFRPQGLFRR